MAKDTSNLSNVLFQLEKGLSCQSCGKVENLHTHAECGGEQCASCWQQLGGQCPQCRQQVQESNKTENELWDLSHILTLNAQRFPTTIEVPVDAFAFLKALRDYNEECTRTRQDEQRQEDKDEETQQPPPQQRLINRNSFGGMAFFGGDESGKRGRVGRRRMENRQEQQQQVPPRGRESSDDAMFDFHSQSSMPTSQASAIVASASASQPESKAAARAPCANEQEEAGESTQGQESQTADEPNTAIEKQQQQETDAAAGKDQMQHNSSESDYNQECKVEESHKESQEWPSREDDSRIAGNTTTTASSRQQHAYQAETEEIQEELSQCSNADTQMEESKQGQQDPPDDADVQMDESESKSNNKQESQQLSPDLLQASQEESQALIATIVGDATEERTTEPPKSRRITILPPAADTSATTSTRKANYQSIITPAISSRKRQRTESHSQQQQQQQQSPLTKEKDNTELDEARARLYSEKDDILVNRPTLAADTGRVNDREMAPDAQDAEVDTASNPVVRNPKGAEFESQGSLQSNHSVASTTIKHDSPPTQHSQTLLIASGALPGTQDLNGLFGSHLDCNTGTLSKPSVQVAQGSLNVPPSIGLHGLNGSNTTSSQGVGGNSVLEAGLGGRHDGIVDTTGADTSDDTQQTLLFSQDLPNTCDFQSLLPSHQQGVSTPNDNSQMALDAKEPGTNSGAEDEIESGSKCDDAPVDEQFQEETTAKPSHESCGERMERHHESSPPSTDTQDTFIPSQALPDTCDFHMLLPSKPDAPSMEERSPATSNDTTSGQAERIASSTTSAFRPTGQGSLNSQTSLESTALPSSGNFRSLMPPPSASPPSRENSSSSQPVARPLNLDSRLSSESSAAALHESQENSISDRVGDSGRVSNNAEHQASQPSTDTQETFIPSQELPSTCDFQTLLPSKYAEPSVSSGNRKREDSGSADVATTACQADKGIKINVSHQSSKRSRSDSDTTCLDGDSQNSNAFSIASGMLPATKDLDGLLHLHSDAYGKTQSKCDDAPVDEKFKEKSAANVSHESGGERMERHHASSPPSTDTQDTFIPSQALPDTCDFQMLLPSKPDAPSIEERSQNPKKSQSGTPRSTAVTMNNATNVPVLGLERSNKSVLTGNQPLRGDVPKSEEGNGNTQNFDEEPASETQQTMLLSQCLPNTADFRALLASNTEQEQPASVEPRSNGNNGKGCAPNDPLDGDGASSKGPTSSFHQTLRGSRPKQHDAIASQVTTFSQYLPKTCDFRMLLPSQASGDSDTSLPVPRMVMDHALEDVDYERARQLCEADVCSADSDISSSTSHYVAFTKSEHNPLLPKASTEICLPTPEYFKALALGIPVVDKKWLKATEIAGRCPRLENTYRVWGDSQLAQKVNVIQRGSGEYSWLKSTEWYQKQCGPGQLPPNMSTRALNGYCILVPEQEYCKPSLGSFRSKTQPRTRTADALFDISTMENGAAIDPDSFQEFNAQDLQTLCNLLGAEVVETEDELVSSDTKLTRLILMPASIPPECFSSFVEQKLVHSALANNMGVLTNTPHSRQFCALRSTWLTDSIGARCHAPLADYSYGILIHGEQRTPDLSDFKRRGRFPDQNDNDSQPESVADI